MNTLIDEEFNITCVAQLEDAGIPVLKELSSTIISHQLVSQQHKNVGLASFLTALAEFKEHGYHQPTWKSFLHFLQSLKLNDLVEKISNYLGSSISDVKKQSEGKV